MAAAIAAAHGLIATRFPRTRKNSSGYALEEWFASRDLLDLVIGAEGTLGFVTLVGLACSTRSPRIAPGSASSCARSTIW